MNILVSGALGRMGKEVITCIEKETDLNLISGFSQEEGTIGEIPVYNDIDKINENPGCLLVQGSYECLIFLFLCA